LGKPEALWKIPNAQWFSLSLRERAGVRGKAGSSSGNGIFRAFANQN
jgi:hypothetical protein